MAHKNQRIVIILLTLFVFFPGVIGVSYASVSMDDIRTRFLKEIGKQWKDATREERADFLYVIQGREIKKEREERVEGEKVPFFIRESYNLKTGLLWENATEREKKLFIKENKIAKKRWEREERLRLKKEKLREKQIRRDQQLKEQKLVIKKRSRKREEKRESEELERKRREEKRKQASMKKKRNALRAKIKELRTKSRDAD